MLIPGGLDLTRSARLHGRKTGFWLEEFPALYYVFKDPGVEMRLTSPKGGQPPLFPRATIRIRKPTRHVGSRTITTHRFKNHNDAQAAPANTVHLSTVSAADYDAVFYPGGHGSSVLDDCAGAGRRHRTGCRCIRVMCAIIAASGR
jgi:putative intracellular protease/amidase